MDGLESKFRTKQQDTLCLMKKIHLNEGWYRSHMSGTLMNQFLHKIRNVVVLQLLRVTVNLVFLYSFNSLLNMTSINDYALLYQKKVNQ